MDAKPLLQKLAKLFFKWKLEVILFGNSAAALHGAPVTTIDLDFYIRNTPDNKRKLKSIAKEIGATIYKPYYPASNMLRMTNEQEGIYLDFLTNAHGIKSFPSLRSRAQPVNFDNYQMLVSALEDIIKSKQSANRPQDKAVLPILRETLRKKNDL